MSRSTRPGPVPRRAPRAGALGAAGLLVVTALGACSAGPDERPDPQDAALALVGALDGGLEADPEAGDLGGLEALAFTETSATEVAREYDEVTAGLAGLTPRVALAGVAETEDEPVDGLETAAATLDWSWEVAGREWTYTTTVAMRMPTDAAAGPVGTWQLDWTRAVVEPSLRERTVLDATTVAARRGEILDGDGRALVTQRPVVRVGIDRTQVPAARAGAAARALAALVDVDAGSFVREVEAAGDEAFVEAIVYRRPELPPAVESAIGSGVGSDAEGLDGARLVPDELPLAPTREFAAPVLGSVGPVTAEMVEDDPEAYQPGDVAGLSGLQARYDEQLQGTDGVEVDAVAPGGGERLLFRVADEDGEALRTTLDEGLQRQAETILADVAPPSALVALRPSDGALLALANGPGNDGQDLAGYGRFAPGSTFKSVASLALLRSGLTPDSTVPCTPTVTVDGRAFENYDDYPSGFLGEVTLRTAVAQSCNTALIAERDRPGRTGVAEAAASLGLGVDRDLGFPAYFGQVPPARSETEQAATMIGQGRVLASPMAMAAVVASIAEGRRVTPRLLPDLEVDASSGDDTPLSSGEAGQLRSLLRSVVTDGSGSLLADVPGPPVIAKTGTAEYDAGDGVGLHAWMIAAQGDLAVAAFVADGESGSATAGPLLERLLRAAG